MPFQSGGTSALNVEPSSAVPVWHVTAGLVQVGGAAAAGPAVTAIRATVTMSSPTWRIASLLSLPVAQRTPSVKLPDIRAPENRLATVGL